jgi:ERCC4-type nuclease
MWLFNFNRKKRKETLAQKEAEIDKEVKRHKVQRDRVLVQSRKVTDNFNKVLNENGITISIHLATGGKRH